MLRSSSRLLYILATIKFILPFVLQDSFYQLHRDEYLYIAEGQHLAWGFMEVPPTLGFLAWISHFFGHGSFWIKLWPDLFGSLTFILAGRIVISLGGKAFALFLAWLPFVIDGYMRLFFLFHPNFLDVFFWTAMAFSLIRFIQTHENKYLYHFGVSAGLGMMGKYSVAFFAVSLAVGLLLTKQRKIFLNKHFWVAIFIALLIFLPNLIWQYNHRFPVIHHMAELQQEQLQFVKPSDFIFSQFMMNLPCVYIWIAGILFAIFSAAGKPFRFIAWAWVIVIALLIILRGKDYYALGAYPVLFALGAYQLETLTAQKWKWVRYAMLVPTFFLGIVAAPLILPMAKPEALAAYYKKTGLNKTGSFKWEDQQEHPIPQDFADMFGWRELALKAGSIYNSIPEEERKKTMIYCRGYFTAGALNYYRNEAGLPEVYSDNASFLLWMPDKYHFSNLMVLARHIPEKDDIVFQQFEKMSIKDSINIPLFRESGMKILYYEHGNDSLNYFIEKGIAKMKTEYKR